MATASIAEGSTEDFQTWTFGPDDSITLYTISFGRMKADFFFCEYFLDSVKAGTWIHALY